MSEAQQRLSDLAASGRVHCTPYGEGAIVWREWCGPEASGLPLVLIHGGFGSWTHWAANIDSLKTARPLWVPDLPGLGDSASLAAPFTTEHFAQVMLNSLNEVLGEDSPFEIGAFSFGAMISGHIAALAGERCRRLTLIGASGFGDLHHQVPLLPPPTQVTSPEDALAITRENLLRLMLAKPESADDFALHIHADNLARHRFRSRKLAGSDDLQRVLGDIKAHLVGVWGEQDATAGDRAAFEARRALFQSAQPNSEFYILSEIGHWAMYEAPEAINNILLGGTPD